MQEIDIDEMRQILQRTPPETLRRVLPRELIQDYIKHHLLEMERMMKSFQAVLTFPTTGRYLPQQALAQMQELLIQDLDGHVKKIQGEIRHLLNTILHMKVAQSHIMLNVVSNFALPYCLLNTIDYRVNQHTVVPCYVTLWAQQEEAKSPVYVWTELSPINPENTIPLHDLKSNPQIVRYPTGQAEFQAFNTVISVELHDVPTRMDAELSGKSVLELLKELKALRESLVRNQKLPGNFLHIRWARYQKSSPTFIAIREMDIAAT
ncbi:hypothetical protein QUF61_09170 [Candidatus Venteria ishoeyi]|uniref:hypothetical protein n=1 Tax=Candidatus Venteria ishoeyi TaxID=1899563 RepID=UPI0025A4D9D5|nr:hypothetical protein [Candidatus Venteria ishoeyi]MDM8546648.1 hypothetical protein [Candidatus Venteria ishoeyi]